MGAKMNGRPTKVKAELYKYRRSSKACSLAARLPDFKTTSFKIETMTIINN
jgi:hypothetical protein